MSKKIKTIILCGIVLILLVAAIVVLKLTEEKPSDVSNPSSVASTEVMLIDIDPKEGASLKVTNASGDYEIKPHGEDAYTIVGYEPYSQDVTQLSLTFSSVSRLAATEIIEEEASDLDKYGLKTPVASFVFTQKDGKTHSYSLGVESFDTSFRYLCETGKNKVYAVKTLNPLLYSGLDYMDKAVTYGYDTQDPSATPKINYMFVSNGKANKPIILEPVLPEDVSESNTIGSALKMTSPTNAALNEQKLAEALYSGFGVIADKVVGVNPTDAQLVEYGFDSSATPTPSILEINYNDDQTIKLMVGKGILCEHEPTEDLTNHVHETVAYNVISDGDSKVFQVKASLLTWLDLEPKDILSSIAVSPYIVDLEKTEVTTGGKLYDIRYQTETVDDIESVIGATVNGKAVADVKNAQQFFQLICLTQISDIASEMPAGTPATSIKYTHKNGKIDTVELYVLPDRSGVVVLNGTSIFKGRGGLSDKIEKEMQNLISDKTVITDW